MTQATAVFAVVETGADGSTAGPIEVPRGKKFITKIKVSVVPNAQPVVTGANFIIKLSGGLAEGEQEIVCYSTQYEEGGGTVTSTKVNKSKPFELTPPGGMMLNGNDIVINAAYVGTDPGTPSISVTLELS